MNDYNVLQLINKSFAYLVDECGFVKKDDRLLENLYRDEFVFEFVYCSIALRIDRGEFYLVISPLAAKKICWTDLEMLIRFLDNMDREGMNTLDKNVTCKLNEKRVRYLSELLRDNLKRIRLLFTGSDENLCVQLNTFEVEYLKAQAKKRWPESVKF